ncbi:MAG: sialidase family protein [Sideroxydans sp.]
MSKYQRLSLLAFVLSAFSMALFKASGWTLAYGFRLPEPPVIKVVEPTQVTTQVVTRSKGRRHTQRIKETLPARGHFDTHFASSQLHVQTHAASMIELSDGNVRAFWFSGSREGAADVTINSAIFDVTQKQWGAEQVVTGRVQTQRDLHRYIAKVGNPVPMRAPDGSLWLFYVTVSLGGWAGSSISMLTSNDEGATWGAPRRLVTSPFINISTLVKAPPFLYADGTVGVPVYHEFVSKFAEALRLDKTGKVIDKQRLAAGGQGTLQPVVLVRNELDALALTRYAGADSAPRVMSLATTDGGRHWSKPQKSNMKNPNAALSALVLPDGKLLAVLNDQEHGRDSLSLQLSADGGITWRELRRLEEMGGLSQQLADESACLEVVEDMLQNSDARLQALAAPQLAEYVASAKPLVRSASACHFEFSYPYLMQAHNGDIHLLYTWNRVLIKHAVFDALWLQQRLSQESSQ